jgi:hypothetical protein
MTGLPLLAVAAAALCATPHRAEAGCAITLDGDAEVVDRVRAELRRFGDGEPPCVALWVQCRQNGNQLEVDLRDELGRSSLHLFASAAGAAAFLVSWSRRPLPERGPSAPAASAPPGLIAPRSPPSEVAAPDSQDGVWHPEISLDYIAATGTRHQWGTLTVAVMKSSGIWRYGGDVRGLTGTIFGNAILEPEIAFGVRSALRPRVTASAELVAGDAVVVKGDLPIDAPDYVPDYGLGGIRAGLRAGVFWQVLAPLGVGPLGVEVRWGYDVLRAPRGGLADVSHVALGLRWLP